MSDQPHPDSWVGRGGSVEDLERVLVAQMLEFINNNPYLKFTQQLKQMGAALGADDEIVLKGLIRQNKIVDAQQMIINILKSEEDNK